MEIFLLTKDEGDVVLPKTLISIAGISSRVTPTLSVLKTENRGGKDVAFYYSGMPNSVALSLHEL